MNYMYSRLTAGSQSSAHVSKGTCISFYVHLVVIIWMFIVCRPAGFCSSLDGYSCQFTWDQEYVLIYYFLFRNSSCIVLWIFLDKIQFDICFILGLQVFTMPEFLQKRFQSQWVRTYLTVVALFSYVFTKFSVGLVLLWNVKFNISILANYVYCMFSYKCSPENWILYNY